MRARTECGIVARLITDCKTHLKHSDATIPINQTRKKEKRQRRERVRPGTLCSSCLVKQRSSRLEALVPFLSASV